MIDEDMRYMAFIRVTIYMRNFIQNLEKIGLDMTDEEKSLDDFLRPYHRNTFDWNEDNYNDATKKLKQYSIYDEFNWVFEYKNDFETLKTNLKNCSNSNEFIQIIKKLIKFIKLIKKDNSHSLNSKNKVLKLLNKIGYDYLKMEALFLQYNEILESTLILECDSRVLIDLFNEDIKKFINSDKYHKGINELEKILKFKKKKVFKFIDSDVLRALSICSYIELACLKADKKLWNYRASTYTDKKNKRNYEKFLFNNLSLIEDKELMCMVDNRFSNKEYNYLDGETIWLFNRIYDDEFLTNNDFLEIKYDKQELLNKFLEKIKGTFEDLKYKIDIPCRLSEMEVNFKKITEYLDLVKSSDIFINENYIDFIYYIYNISYQYMKLEFKFFDKSIIYDYFMSNLHDYNYVGELVKKDIENMKTSVNYIKGMDKLISIIDNDKCIDNMDKRLVINLSRCHF